jgi:hypothetical protein
MIDEKIKLRPIELKKNPSRKYSGTILDDGLWQIRRDET